jgi:hypothetical protein
MIPTNLKTSFGGAGKTTLLNRLDIIERRMDAKALTQRFEQCFIKSSKELRREQIGIWHPERKSTGIYNPIVWQGRLQNRRVGTILYAFNRRS